MGPGSASKFFAMLCVAWMSAPLPAQVMPHFSRPTRGVVLDDATGAPVEGAVVVARWDWLAFHQTFESHSYSFNGDALHIGEALTDRQGRFDIPGWGPAVRPEGKLDEKAPNLLVFKSGYEPLQRRGPGSDPLRLKKSGGAPKAYAESILRFQGGAAGLDPTMRSGPPGLAWLYPGDNWKRMPRMIDALHREKLRLGEDGAAILGAQRLAGRSGAGAVVDAQTKQPIRGATVSIAWTLRRGDAKPGTMRVTQSKRASSAGSDSQFYVSPWRLPGPEVPGWEIATDTAPLIRVYAPGYRRSPEIAWDEKGGLVALEKLPPERDAFLAEMRAAKRDADASLALADRATALKLQRALLAMLADQCRALTPDLRQGVCYEESSDVAAFLRTAAPPGQFIEDEDGTRFMRVVAVGGGASAIQAQSVRAGAAPAYRKPSVSGFSIEPAR